MHDTAHHVMLTWWCPLYLYYISVLYIYIYVCVCCVCVNIYIYIYICNSPHMYLFESHRYPIVTLLI